MNYVKKYLHNPTYRVAQNFCGSLFVRIDDFLCFAGTNFWYLDKVFFSCWELIFAIFRKYPVPSVDHIFCIFVFSENVQQKYIFSNK